MSWNIPGPNDLQDKATHQVVVGMKVGHKHSLQIPENVSSLLAKVTIQLPRGPLPAVQDQSGIVPTDHTTLGSHDKHGCQTLENVTSLFTTVIVQLRSPPLVQMRTAASLEILQSLIHKAMKQLSNS